MTTTADENGTWILRTAETFARHEIYLHWLILIAAAVIIVLSFSMTLVGNNQVYLPGFPLPLPESCTARIYFGLDCPACGLTRGFICISQGRFGDAWMFNPASYVAYLFFAIQVPWQGYQIWRLKSGRNSVDELWIYYLPMAMTVVLIVQWFWRVFA